MVSILSLVSSLLLGSFQGHSSLGPPVPKISFPVEKFLLKNGLTVLLAPDPSVRLISYHTWYKVGSKDEEPGATGLAHLFEHMMFKGSPRYPGKQFDQAVSFNGGSSNAFTTQDYTGYFINFPSGKLELAADLESDRMRSLIVNEEGLKSEREVVKEERRLRVETDPMGLLFEQIFGTTFKIHPYRWPVVGSMKDLDNVSVEKAKEFFRRYYSPGNAVIVVSGDIDPKIARQTIMKYYENIPSATVQRNVIPREPPQRDERTVTIRENVQNDIFSVSFITPPADDEDNYAIDLLASVLGKGNSSRLYRRLVYEDQLANSVMAESAVMESHGLFLVLAHVREGQDINSIEKAIFGEIWNLRNKLLPIAEVEKAKNQVMKTYVDFLKTTHGKAHALAMNEVLRGSHEELFRDLEKYASVNPDTIKRVAAKYFNPSQRSVVIMKPKIQKSDQKDPNKLGSDPQHGESQ